VSREERFWVLAEPLLARPGVTRSTMMGFPCLRLDGQFFASCDPRTGDLVIKLDADQAAELIDSGRADAFAPNGRRFREWVSISGSKRRSWGRLLAQAFETAMARRSVAVTDVPFGHSERLITQGHRCLAEG
jgi:hypothetical protein